MDLDELALRDALVRRLHGAGVTTVEDLRGLCARELLQIPGVGPRAVESIEEALEAAGAGLADDPFGRYTCARHGQPAGDAGLTSFFICRDCSRDWIGEAFDGTDPEWEGEAVTGYCIACNVRKDVRLRQWFLCAVCERVARSVGRSVEAERSVGEFWAAAFDDWELEGVDPPRLRRAQSGRGGIAATLDFLVSRAGHRVVGIELKTGRSEIGGTGIGTRIGRFQLDVSDCDAIHDAARDARVVPYVLHAQVIDRAEAPTVRHTATGLWFAEYPALREAFLETRQRPRENRPAAYFDVGAFRPIVELPDHLAASDPVGELEELERLGWPALYL
jgi:hypothetical protein